MKKMQSGFTLIELVMVIVILGILAASALPKFVNLSSSAADAAADGVLGSARSGAAINFAAARAGTAAASLPAYDASTCTTGLISAADTTNNAGTCVINSLAQVPSDWTASGNTITASINGTTYTITVSADETNSVAATFTQSW